MRSIICFVLPIIGLISNAPGTALAQAVPPPPPNIVVVGDGEASASPDVAVVSFNVQVDADTPDLAVLQNATNVTGVIAGFRRVGVEDQDVRISGVNLSTFEVRVPAQGGGAGPETPQQFVNVTRFRAVNTLVVTVRNLARISEVLAAGAAGGASVNGTPRFAMRDDTELRQQALNNAAREAHAEAEALAAALGVRLTGLISATEEPPPGDQPAIGATTQRARVRLVYSVSAG